MVRRNPRRWSALAAVIALLLQCTLGAFHTHAEVVTRADDACLTDAGATPAAVDAGNCADTDHAEDSCSICQTLSQGRFGVPVPSFDADAFAFAVLDRAPVAQPQLPSQPTDYKHSPRAPPAAA
jgi:hypothetical protein